MRIDRLVSDRRKKQKERKKVLLGIGVFLAGYFIFFAIFFLLTHSPFLQVSEVDIKGTNAVSQGEIMSLLQASIANNNASIIDGRSSWRELLGFKNILTWPAGISSTTLSLIPQLATLSISKNYFTRTITVDVSERQPFAVWCLMPSDECFWFDQNGEAFSRTVDTQGSAILIVHDYAQSQLAVNEKVLPDQFLANFISIAQVLKASELPVGQISLRDLSLEELDVTTPNGPSIRFSLRYPATDDLAALRSLMAKPDFMKLQYIDFTVQDRAYYK
jgi:cell division septal protein FtsQ